MNKFEFMLKKTFVQNRWRLLLSFLLFLIPSQIFRIFFAFVFFSRRLPREIERGEDEVLLELPLRRWEIFVNDFLINSSVLIVSGALSVALSGKNSLEVSKLFKTIVAFPYIYGLEVLCAKYMKSNFLIPFTAFVIDLAFWGTRWRYISPLSEKSVFGVAISTSIFLIALFSYFIEDFGGKENGRSKRSVQEL